MSSIEDQACSFLIVDENNSQILNQWKYNQRVVSNKNKYKNVSRFFINILSEFFQADSLAKNNNSIVCKIEIYMRQCLWFETNFWEPFIIYSSA